MVRAGDKSAKLPPEVSKKSKRKAAARSKGAESNLNPLSRKLRAAFDTFEIAKPILAELELHNFVALPDLPAPPPQPFKDWRANNVISPISDQMPFNACVAFALASTIEAALAIHHNDFNRVSPAYIHTCVAHDGVQPPPAQPDDLILTIQKLRQSGFTQAANIPYPCPGGACQGPPLRLVTDTTLIAGPNHAKTCLFNFGPIIAEMYIWQDFFDYRGQTPLYIANPATGFRGLHAVCVIGYEPQGWIIKNSFGPGWGAQGFAIIPYGTCGLISPPPPPYGLQARAFSLAV